MTEGEGEIAGGRLIDAAPAARQTLGLSLSASQACRYH